LYFIVYTRLYISIFYKNKNYKINRTFLKYRKLILIGDGLSKDTNEGDLGIEKIIEEKAQLAIKIASDLTDKPEIVDESLIRDEEIKMETIELSHWYGDNRVLSGISAPIFKNKVTAIIGPSGCGKSTFLRDLNRMNDLVPISRISGEVKLDGQNIYEEGIDVVHLRKTIGMAFA